MDIFYVMLIQSSWTLERGFLFYIFLFKLACVTFDHSVIGGRLRFQPFSLIIFIVL